MILTILAAVTLAIWLYLTFLRGAFWRVSDDSAPLGPPPPRRVAVVIPARDEEEFIGRAVLSLKRQQWPADLRVFVVDDHSSDSTAALARAAGATVIESQPLPSGWTGKLWAVSQGVARAIEDAPDYLLLTDADIEHAPDSLAALASRAEAWKLDLASYMVRLRTGNAAEKMLIPAFVYFFLKLYPPRWIAQAGSRTAGAAGGAMLIRPAALERAGGIEAIRAELIDDCSLARAVKRNGRIWMGLTSTTRSVRPYPDAATIGDMIARTAFTQLRHSWLLLAGTIAGMALTYLAPPLLLIAGSNGARVLAGAACLLMFATYARMLRFYRLSLTYALALPLTAAFYSAATVQSALRHARGSGGRWKGRVQDKL